MTFSSSVIELIKRRYSCRAYQQRAIAEETQRALSDFLVSRREGPFGTRGRFTLVASTGADQASLKGLGTYGFIKDAPGFIVGSVEKGSKAFEDFGYLMEHIILRATDLGLGTCWLGGTFSKSRFAKKIALARNELMPAVASVGYIKEGCQAQDRIRRLARSSHRLPSEALFCEGSFGKPVPEGGAGPYVDALEMVRWAPSASNKQPWRIVHTEGGWHFYLERTKGYGKGSLVYSLLRLADLQRVDLGIAMCHFELVARERGLAGSWVLAEPNISLPSERTQYTATWRPLG